MDDFNNGKAMLQTNPWFSNKYTSALPMFEQAAVILKSQQLYSDAGEAYIQAAICCQALKNTYATAKHYVHAGSCFVELYDYHHAIRQYEKAVDLFFTEKNWLKTATTYYDIACLYDILNNVKAIPAYKHAAYYYTICNMQSKSNKCKECLGYFYAKQFNYSEAAILFELIGKGSTNSYLFIRNQLINALICHIHLGTSRRVCAEFRPYFTNTDYDHVFQLIHATSKHDILQHLSRLPLISPWATDMFQHYASTFT
jgi:tetratricopeptide (TPR) repeat protein